MVSTDPPSNVVGSLSFPVTHFTNSEGNRNTEKPKGPATIGGRFRLPRMVSTETLPGWLSKLVVFGVSVTLRFRKAQPTHRTIRTPIGAGLRLAPCGVNRHLPHNRNLPPLVLGSFSFSVFRFTSKFVKAGLRLAPCGVNRNLPTTETSPRWFLDLSVFRFFGSPRNS